MSNTYPEQDQQMTKTDLKHFADGLVCEQIAENEDPAGKTHKSDDTK